MPELVNSCLRGHPRTEENITNSRNCLLCKNELSAKRRKSDPRKHLLCNARTRSKTMHIESNLTLEDLTIPEYCPILEIKLGFGSGDRSPSIDRIVPNLGYVKGNVQIISLRANKIKNNATPEELKLVS